MRPFKESEMHKIYRFLVRTPGCSPEAFAAGWRGGLGAALVAAAPAIPGLARYAQNDLLPVDSPLETARAQALDGIEEFWFEDRASAEAFLASVHDRPETLPFESAILGPASTLHAGPLHIMWQRPPEPQGDALKVIYQSVRKATLTPLEFQKHWLEVHSPLTLQGPTMRQHVQRVEFCPAGAPGGPCDGVGAIWFDTLRHLQAEFGSEYYREVLAPDEARFTDPARSRGFMVRERCLWGRLEL